MSARIFISYRTADGADKATSLARELGTRFGDDQVFLDKDDLRGGSAWRDEVQRALGAKPVLLLLLTPGLFGATDASGALRIADPDDPVRRELASALEAGATVIPLCCDGVETPPSNLPPPFDRIRDYTWRRLRAYDWKNDLQRLCDDLTALGLTEATAATPTAGDGSSLRRRALVAGGVAVLGLLATLGWRAWKPEAPPPAAPPAPAATAPPPAAASAPIGLPGTWIATVADEQPFALTLLQQEDRLAMTSEPMPVDGRAGWAGYRAAWQRLTGTELRTLLYRGEGTVLREPGAPLTVDIGWTVFNGAGDTRIGTGNLHAAAAADGQSLIGTLWSHSDQQEHPITLRRPR